MPASVKRLSISVPADEYPLWEAKAAAYQTTITGLLRYAVEALPEPKKPTKK